MIARLRSTFGASHAAPWAEYALEASKAIETWQSPDFSESFLAVQEMRALARIPDPRSRPLWHIVFSYAPDEPTIVPAARAMLERFHHTLTKDYRARTGRDPLLLWIAAAHADAHCRHVHEMLLTLDADSGERLVPEGLVAKRLRAFSLEESTETARTALTLFSVPLAARMRDGEIWNGQISFGRFVAELLEGVQTWRDHDSRISAFGIDLLARTKGYVYVERDANGASVAVALSRVLDRKTRAQLGPRPPFERIGRPFYPGYSATRANLIEPKLPGGIATLETWRRFHGAGYPVGRLGEFARRHESIMNKHDSSVGARRSSVPQERFGPTVVVTAVGRALRGVPLPDSGARAYQLFDGLGPRLYASLDEIDFGRARNVLIIDTLRTTTARIERHDAPDAFSEEHRMDTRSISAAQLQKELAQEIIYLEIRPRDPEALLRTRTTLSRASIDQVRDIEERLRLAPPDQQFIAPFIENDLVCTPEFLTQVAPLLPELPFEAKRAQSWPIGETWESLHASLHANAGMTYGFYTDDDGKRIGAIFTLADGGAQYITDGTSFGYSNLDLDSLESALGPIVEPGNHDAKLTRAERERAGAAVLNPRIALEFQEAVERARAVEKSKHTVELDKTLTHTGEGTFFAQNSIGNGAPVRQRPNIGNPGHQALETPEVPLLVQLRAEYETFLDGRDIDPFAKAAIDRYDRARTRAFNKVADLRDEIDQREGKPVDLRDEELRVLQRLAYAQDEAVISLGLADDAQFETSTFKSFLEEYAGIDESTRKKALRALASRPEPAPMQSFRYDASLAAVLATAVAEDVVKDRLAYYEVGSPKRTRFYESDERFFMRRLPSNDDIDVALRLAQARYGTVEIRGDDRFVERALKRAVELGIDVSGERHQERLETLRSELTEARLVDAGSRSTAVVLPEWAREEKSQLRGQAGSTELYEQRRVAELVGRSVFGVERTVLGAPSVETLKIAGITVHDNVADGDFLGQIVTPTRTFAVVDFFPEDRKHVMGLRHASKAVAAIIELPNAALADELEEQREAEVSVVLADEEQAELYFGTLGEERQTLRETAFSR